MTTQTTTEIDAANPLTVAPDEAPASPALILLRDEAKILNNIFSVLGAVHIIAREHQKAGELLDYVDAKIKMTELAIAAQLEKEGKTVAA